MTALDRSPEIVRLANTLGIHQHLRPSEAIIEYCMDTVGGWIGEFEAGTVESLLRVEKIVCAKLRLKFEFIETDEDLGRVEKYYVEKKEYVIKNLLSQLDDKTFGAVFEREHSTERSPDRYVAVIDCRDSKKHRRFFTKWHEIAHLLTLKGQLEFALFRDTDVKTPEEKMMDQIAACVGFYPPIFRRGFDAEYSAFGRFSFGLVQRVRDNVCPDASYEATLHACLGQIFRPCLLVRIELGLSDSEKKLTEQPFLIPGDAPIPVLRAVKITGNEAAREQKLTIHRNMRVPAVSSLYRAFHELSEGVEFGDEGFAENMEIWEHSNGSTLAPREVRVFARRQGHAVQALIVEV